MIFEEGNIGVWAYNIETVLAEKVETIKSTAAHRETSHIFNDIGKRIDEFENSETLKTRWNKYTKDYRYAEDIEYSHIIDALRAMV